jgi:hypothetical protein
MSAGTLRLRKPIVAAIALAVMILGLIAAYASMTPSAPSRGLHAELLSHNKNDGKDACPNDGNAGKGNDNKGPNGGCREHPPAGGYGNVN